MHIVRAFFFIAVFAMIMGQAAAKINPDLAALSIVINLPSRTLELFSGRDLIKAYPVAIGKPSTPTPLGEYYIFEKVIDPAWYPPRTGEVVPSGPNNPLGYRWMEFSPLVGIHGTNAPWYIGMAVSNGCVRMREEDVEELFEVVRYGTPVRVTYDRVRVRIAATGEVSLDVYPDVYGYRAATAAEVRDKLRAAGLDGWLGDADIENMIGGEADRRVVFAQVHAVRVNGRTLVERAVGWREQIYIPAWPVAEALGAEIAWDEGSARLRSGQRTAAGVLRGGRLYITAEDSRWLFGGQQAFLAEDNIYVCDVLRVFVNGREIVCDVQMVDGVLALPVPALAEALGRRAVPQVPCSVVGDVPYIQLTRICDFFGAYVYWNRDARTIELTYPFDVKDGTD